MSAESTLSSVASPSRPQILEDVKRIAGEVLDIPSDEIEEQYVLDSDLGCDSLDFVEIMTAVEDQFGISIQSGNGGVDRATPMWFPFEFALCVAPVQRVDRWFMQR